MRDQALLSRRALASALPIAALTAAPAAALPALPFVGADAELLDLGAHFEVAWEHQARAGARLNAAPRSLRDDDLLWIEHDRLHGETVAIVDKIEMLRATTLAGLAVKARACAWTHSGEAIEADFFDDHPATDARLAASILRDLVILSGRPLPEGDA